MGSHCYNVPAWHKALWNEHADADTTGKVEEAGTKGDARVAGFSGEFLPELFHRLYALNPREVDKPAPGAVVRTKLHRLVSDLPEFETLRKQTVRDPLWAGVGASALADKLADKLPARTTPPPDPDRVNRIHNGLRDLKDQGAKLDEQVRQAEKDAQKSEQDAQTQADGLPETAIRQGLREAIAEAQAEIDEMQEALDALGCGCGTGMGSDTAMRDPAQAIELCERIKSSAKLKEIIALAGRLRAAGRAKRATRSEYARSELVGVEPTGAIENLMPSELGALDDSDRETDLYRRLFERSALGYKLRGRERESRGPVVIAIDQSGSMGGHSDTWAKAVALAVLDAAREQRRAFGIILYADGVRTSRLFPEAGKADPKAVLDVLSRAPSGGTSFNGAMDKALEWIGGAAAERAFKKADVINITDGAAGTSGASACVARADKLGVRLYGVLIGASDPGNALRAWTHEAHGINDLGQDGAMVDVLGKL